MVKRSGRWSYQFTLHGKRSTFALGKADRTAERYKSKLDDLVEAVKANVNPPPDVAAWIGGLSPKLRAKLAESGLIPRGTLPEMQEPCEAPTLEQFLAQYLDLRGDVKQNTRKKYESTRRALVKFFGVGKRLDAITAGGAEEWRQGLLKKGLAENSVRKHIAVAKVFFGWAVAKEWLYKCPFRKMKSSILANESRYRFVTKEETQRVIDCCIDGEWRLIVALARYGGLRVPSELLALRWKDVDWIKNEIRVTSPKTEHHPGKGSRTIPLFPPLRSYLEEVFDPESEFVVNRYRDSGQNLRTQMMRTIEKAGLEVWPKPFQNLRSSRQTELAEEFAEHVVCRWMGNSKPVARKHYLQETADHHARAMQEEAWPTERCKSAAARPRTHSHGIQNKCVFHKYS